MSNGGALWINRGSGSCTIPFRVARFDANHIWAANSNSEVLYTTNSDKNWNARFSGFVGSTRAPHGRYRVSQQQRRLGGYQWRFHNFELGVAQPGRGKDMANLERDRHWTPQRLGHRRCLDAHRRTFSWNQEIFGSTMFCPWPTIHTRAQSFRLRAFRARDSDQMDTC